MVRKYQAKKTKNKFSDEALQMALQDLKEKKGSIRKVAATYGIPSSTLHDHYTGVSTKRYGGPSTALTYDEEREIVQSCIVLQEMGFPLDRAAVTSVVADYMKAISSPNPFACDAPGPDWFLSFMKRWKTTLSQRKPQHLSRKRAKGLTIETVSNWMELAEKLYRQAGLTRLSKKELSKRIWNCDETAFATTSTSKWVIARRGCKSIYETMAGSGREYITVHWCGNANGDKIPPYVLYKAQHLYSIWTLGGPDGSLYGVSTSGWMEKPNFQSWFTKGFIPHLKRLKLIPMDMLSYQEDVSVVECSNSDDYEDVSDPGVVLFFDGHYSHINLDVIKAAKKSKITLVTLPPNTTHALQPLDVGVFGPMKKAWKQILQDHRRKTHGRGIDKTVFPALIKDLCKKTLKPSHFQSGFRCAGLYPEPKASAIPTSLLAPADAVADGSKTPSKSPHPRTFSTASTPAVKLQLRHHFSKLFQISATPKAKSKPKPSSRIPLAHYGEVLTTNEALGRIQEQEEKRQLAKASKAPKKKRKGPVQTKVTQTEVQEDRDENTCQGCKRAFEDDEEEKQQTWVGCEWCWRWFHYDCAGLTDMPEEEDPWACPTCS